MQEDTFKDRICVTQKFEILLVVGIPKMQVQQHKQYNFLLV
jgi:hypothetical protein